MSRTASAELEKRAATHGDGVEVSEQREGELRWLWLSARHSGGTTGCSGQTSAVSRIPSNLRAPETAEKTYCDHTAANPMGGGVDNCDHPPDLAIPDGKASTRPPSERWSSPNGSTSEVNTGGRQSSTAVETPRAAAKVLLPTGVLSHDSLLAAKEKQRRELLWYKDHCREQEVELHAMRGKQAVLEDTLIGARIAALSEKERCRELVEMAATQRREARLALEPHATALRALEDELGGLRRELRQSRKLLERSEEGRAALLQQQQRQEAEIEALKGANESMRNKLEGMHTKYAILEQVIANNVEATSARSANARCNEGKTVADTQNEHARAVEHPLRVTLLEMAEEVERRRFQANAVEEMCFFFVDHIQNVLKDSSDTMVSLWRHGKQLVETFRSSGGLLSGNTSKFAQEAEVQSGCPYTVLLRCADSVARQLQTIEEVIGDQLVAATEQQRDINSALQSERRVHEEEVKVMQQTLQMVRRDAEDTKEKLAAANHQYIQLEHAARNQCRQLLAICKGVSNKKCASEGSNKEWHQQRRKDSTETVVTTVARGEKTVDAGIEGSECVSTVVEAILKPLDAGDSLHYRGTTSVRGEEETVQTLLQRTRRVVRCALEDALGKQNLGEARWSKECRRHKASAKRLETLLKTAREREVDLEKKLSAAVIDRKNAAKRAKELDVELRSSARQQRELKEELQALREDCEMQRQTVANRCQHIEDLKVQLSRQSEQQFEISVLRRRCDDLVRVADALEQCVRREEKGKRALYELAKCFCGILVSVVLRMRTLTAERSAMWFAYQAVDEDHRTAVSLLRDTMRRIGVGGSGQWEAEQLLYSTHRHSLFSVTSVVVACVRMARLMRPRRRGHHVSFDICDEEASNNDNKVALETCVHSITRGVAQPNSLRAIIESVPCLSSLLLKRGVSEFAGAMQIPPLPNFLSAMISAHEKSSTAGPASLLQHFIDCADVDAASGVYLTHFVHSAIPSRRTQVSRWARMSKRSRDRFHCGGSAKTGPEQVRQAFELIVGHANELMCEVGRQKEAVRSVQDECQRLQTELEESQRRVASLLLKQEEYELETAAMKAVYRANREMDQRVRELHEALHKEREARRSVEEMNSQLRMREVELLSTSHKLRDEVRSLSIELAEQDQSYATRKHKHSSNHTGVTSNNSRSLYQPQSVYLAEDCSSLSSKS